MAERENPYQADLPAGRWFVGRAQELDEAEQAARTGRHALRAFMGGRGMGKSSLLGAIARRIDAFDELAIVRVDRPSRDPAALAQVLCAKLGVDGVGGDITAVLSEALMRPGAPRLVVLIDEVEVLLDTQAGQDFIENLRTVYEHAPRRLAVFLFGGVRLRVLLTGGASPFLRTARFHALRGFDFVETGRLMREPLALEVDDAIVDLVWQHTNGHPLLVQRVMERATDRAFREGVAMSEHIRTALGELESDGVLFSVWWDNLTAEGQRVFRALVRQSAPVADAEAARRLGDRPFEWIEVLESTGVARRIEGATAPRGELFRQWFLLNFADETRGESPVADGLPRSDRWGATDFEREVVAAVARWVRDTLEHPAYAIRARSGRKGNELLQEEDYYQISLLQALRQHDWRVEAESLSGGRKQRADLKVRSRDDQRACGEVKRWAGDPREYKALVTQVLSYAMPTDAFAFTVMVDRSARPLAPAYARECIPAGSARLWPAEAAPEAVRVPALVTEHERAGAPPIRVYHFLLQLPADQEAEP